MRMLVCRILRQSDCSLAGAVALLAVVAGHAQETIKLGLVAAMSGQSAKSGEAIVRGLSLAIDEINAKGGVLGKKVELSGPRRRKQPRQGRRRRARAGAAREGRGAVRRSRHAGVDRDRAVRQQRQGAVHGRVGGGHADHHATARAENYVFRVSAVDEIVDIALVDYAVKKYGAKKPGMILINNPWGEVEREGPQGRARSQEDSLRGHREIRDQRRRRGAAADAPEAGRLRCAVPGRQRRAVRAGGEVARPHELGRADRLALGPGRRPLLRARRPERREGPLHPDLQLLGQALAEGRGRARRR